MFMVWSIYGIEEWVIFHVLISQQILLVQLTVSSLTLIIRSFFDLLNIEFYLKTINIHAYVRIYKEWCALWMLTIYWTSRLFLVLANMALFTCGIFVEEIHQLLSKTTKWYYTWSNSFFYGYVFFKKRPVVRHMLELGNWVKLST